MDWSMLFLANLVPIKFLHMVTLQYIVRVCLHFFKMRIICVSKNTIHMMDYIPSGDYYRIVRSPANIKNPSSSEAVLRRVKQTRPILFYLSTIVNCHAYLENKKT